ncbi:MAG: Uma2 family endonuclease [Cyanobacteria bacterium P01_G01_bin.54]
MTISPPQPMTLAAFLQAPYIEDSPAWEYLNGRPIQKPMPQGQHSTLQSELVSAINQVGKRSKVAYAFPERRCTFTTKGSIVPDIAVIRWASIPRTETGEVANLFERSPDWTIEILSPAQSPNRVAAKIMACLQHGCELGWLIDPGDRSVMVFRPKQEPAFYRDDQTLPVLNGLDLFLTTDKLFSWLMLEL